MRKLLLTAAALGGFTALATSGAEAAPTAVGPHMAIPRPSVTQIDYYWHRHHWHHRRWVHHSWHYWD